MGNDCLLLYPLYRVRTSEKAISGVLHSATHPWITNYPDICQGSSCGVYYSVTSVHPNCFCHVWVDTMATGRKNHRHFGNVLRHFNHGNRIRLAKHPAEGYSEEELFGRRQRPPRGPLPVAEHKSVHGTVKSVRADCTAI